MLQSQGIYDVVFSVVNLASNTVCLINNSEINYTYMT